MVFWVLYCRGGGGFCWVDVIGSGCLGLVGESIVWLGFSWGIVVIVWEVDVIIVVLVIVGFILVLGMGVAYVRRTGWLVELKIIW